MSLHSESKHPKIKIENFMSITYEGLLFVDPGCIENVVDLNQVDFVLEVRKIVEFLEEETRPYFDPFIDWTVSMKDVTKKALFSVSTMVDDMLFFSHSLTRLASFVVGFINMSKQNHQESFDELLTHVASREVKLLQEMSEGTLRHQQQKEWTDQAVFVFDKHVASTGADIQ
jgi:hypothetical protein